MKLAVVGLGLIGGSMALDLKKCGFITYVYGVDQNESNAEEAKRLNLVDEITTLESACHNADLIVLATPVGAIVKLLPEVLTLIKDSTVVTDVGSTKGQISESVKNHPRRKHFVPSHPMAGTEFSGPKAAMFGLFKNKAAVICDEEDDLPANVELIKKMYEALEMRVIFMKSNEHDLHAAYVSHLSHISSFILANTVLDKRKDVDAIFNLASAGFESTVRLAKSSPEMWTPIFEQNHTFVVEALGSYIRRLTLFHESLVNRDFEQTKKYMERSNEIRQVLARIQNPQPQGKS